PLLPRTGGGRVDRHGPRRADRRARRRSASRGDLRILRPALRGGRARATGAPHGLGRRRPRVKSCNGRGGRRRSAYERRTDPSIERISPAARIEAETAPPAPVTAPSARARRHGRPRHHERQERWLTSPLQLVELRAGGGLGLDLADAPEAPLD